MTGPLNERLALQLNTRAKSLLREEYPLAEKYLSRKGGLRTVIHSLEGAGRFVIGLAADVKILEGDFLNERYPIHSELPHSTKGEYYTCEYGSDIIVFHSLTMNPLLSFA